MTQLYLHSRHVYAVKAKGFTYIELLVVLALLAVGISFLLPVRRSGYGCSNRVKCASNLRQIGQAMLLYSNDNRGHYPRTIYVPGQPTNVGSGPDYLDPFKSPGPAPNDVTAALFLLLRTQDITTEVFVCPNSNAERDMLNGHPPIERSNFTDLKKNLSYSMHNPYPNEGVIVLTGKTFWTNAMSADFAVAADLNPGASGTGDNVMFPSSTSSAVQMRSANSNNHEKDGQNILYADGHVSFENNPFVGIARDNIYTTKDNQLLASQVNDDDSVLLPTDD